MTIIIPSTFSILFLVILSVNLAYALDPKSIQNLLEDIELPKNLTNEQLEQFEDFKSFVDKKIEQDEEKTKFNCLSGNPELDKIAKSHIEGQEKIRNDYKLYGDSALSALKDLPKQFIEVIKDDLETEILMEKVKTNENIEYTDCSHLESVKLELTNILKQGDESWNQYWQNQEADLSKKEIKQIKEYIQKWIDATNK